MIAASIPEAHAQKKIVKWCIVDPEFGLLMMECMAEIFKKQQQQQESQNIARNCFQNVSYISRKRRR